MSDESEGSRCYLCKRVRTPDQLFVAFKTKGAIRRYCTDTDDCEEFQLAQRERGSAA